MNKKVYLFWSFFMPILNLVFLIIITNSSLRAFFSHVFIEIYGLFSIIFLIYSLILLFLLWAIIHSPNKKRMPLFINWDFKADSIEVNEKRGIYETIIKGKKIRLDMRGWIFRKRAVADIILLYKHVSFFNVKCSYNEQIIKKDFFKDECDLCVNFLTRKGNKKIFIIKDGKEKRSVFLSLKLHFFLYLHAKHGESKGYRRASVYDFYL